MKAYLKNYRQSPRKVRLVADLIRGKKVNKALTLLSFTQRRATGSIKKLLESAIANAKKNSGIDKENLTVKDIQINKGIVFKRHQPRARGRAFPIRKRTSNISIVLSEQQETQNNSKKSKI
ncbi:50S ribosomal protein L22 [Candidatus Campbellbacteria bacterium CG10_big_fil_rev_8_21_14_0_10_35_52]|uniref:Large ribosomal subunit protein uL22 n=1 Tax=Candidatus Campbellbacteria bacterium CG10_big_fil_rev_8_21_14_0_10_35_52 TaxID=1974527 RepID=A0A2M6WVP8_9BACT|nr:MAG: 50S ribosomal protein L22 [Candidatus Campbellbacteria bacterium CG10_big_fil_rev_8_21_14_0_10_35_52]